MQRLKIRLLLSIFFIMLVLGMAYFWLPEPAKWHDNAARFNAQIYSNAFFDRHNQLLSLSLANDQRYRLYTPIGDIPQSLIDATISYEDQDYYSHWGIDLTALIRAFYQTYIIGERKIGASTLPMQVARLKWDINSSTIAGKVLQIIRAIQLVKYYEKDQILEMYFNLAPYGGNIESVGAASLIYFNKHVSEVNELEAIMLAVIPQNPNKRNPQKRASWKHIKTAINLLYARQPELFPNLDKTMLSAPIAVSTREHLPNVAPHFTDFIKSQLVTRKNSNNWIDRQYVKTSLDSYKQQWLEQSLQVYVNRQQRFGLRNAAALLINHKTMHIEAMVGSADFDNVDIFGQVNGTLAKRSPGSTLKPLLFGLSIDAGLIHPGSILKDLPNRYAEFSPENADEQYLGPLTATQALIMSRNLPAVELQQKLTAKAPDNDLYQTLQKAGLDLREPAFYGLALSLGGLELSMLELLEIYAGIANAGRFSKALFLLGDELLSSNSTNVNLMSGEASALVMDMLRQNPAPTESTHPSYNHLSPRLTPQVAWKTGTSWGFRDGWAVGVSGDYAAAVWVGNFDGSGNPIFKGAQTAGPVLFDIFRRLHETSAIPSNWKIDELYQNLALNIRPVDICKASGDLFEQACPEAVSTLFIPGVSPIQSSNVFRRIAIHAPTGLRACNSNRDDAVIKTFAVWPSDIARNFASAGRAYESTPALHPDCNADEHSYLSAQPKISSPQQQVNYVARPNAQGTSLASIALQASVDGLINNIHWFVNDHYLTTVSPQSTYIWTAPVGVHKVQVIDDLGQISTVNVQITQD